MSRSAREIRNAVRARETTAAAEVEAALGRIDATDSRLRFSLHRSADDARAKAERLDQRIARGERVGPLAGVPIALKDNLCTSFAPTTCASRMLAGFVPPYDADVVERLEQAGAIVICKTNLDEFAMGSSTENSALHPTLNPWDPTRVPGGSSGGSAVAVAARVVPLALGSDTGGSIRQPAAFTGVCGLKPTYGRVSRYGLVAFASSLDQVGLFAHDAADLALGLDVIAGHDPRDSTSVDRESPDHAAACARGVAGLRIGLPSEYFADGLDAEIRAAVESAVEQWRALGATTVEVALPHTAACVACYYVICMAEASSNLARYDGVHYGFRSADVREYVEVYSRSREQGLGAEVKRRIMLGTYALSSGYYDAYYHKALQVRTRIRDDFLAAFERCDLIIGPTAPTPPYRLGEKTSHPLEMYLGDIYTVSANLAGIPGLSIPCGFTASGLPIGVQLLAPHFEEPRLLAAAAAYQQQTDFHRRTPPICAAAES